MLIKLKPLDTLFFRDAKSFSKGDDTWANGIFPPAPSVFYGALRSAWFSHHIDELKKANMPDDPTKNLIIKGIYLRTEEMDYLPLPQDLVVSENEKEKAVILVLSDISKYAHSGKTDSVLTQNPDSDDKVQSVQDGLIETGNFNNYLSIENRKFLFRNISEQVISEPKIGIERNNHSRSCEDGMLYRVGMNRCKDLSFVLEFEGLNLPEKGFIKIGGEGKAVSYESISEFISVKIPEIKENTFKIYISTPAIFKNGWLPGWINPDTLDGTIPDTACKTELITASLAKPINIGGYDIKANQPKPMRKAVGGGSVYYFKLLEGKMDEVISAIHGKSISDDESDRKQGFGICYAGRIKL